MPLSRLVYASLRQSLTSQDLVDILEQSEARNAVDGITGALVVTPEHYVQMLEGQREVVTACYERIRRDPRHSHVGLILFELVEERLFPDWSMSSADMSEGGAMLPYTEGEAFRPDELPTTVVKRLFADLAAGLRKD